MASERKGEKSEGSTVECGRKGNEKSVLQIVFHKQQISSEKVTQTADSIRESDGDSTFDHKRYIQL